MRKVIFAFIAVCLCGCNNTQPQTSCGTVVVDLDNTKPVDIHIGEITELETPDKSLLAYIDGFVIDEGRFFIKSRGEVFAFDSAGSYLFGVGAKGRGPNEYISADCIFMKGDSLAVYDWQSRRLLLYDRDGGYLSDRRVNSSDDGLTANGLFPLHAGGYIAANVFQGVPGKTPVFSRMNDKFEYEYDYSGLCLQSGSYYYDTYVGLNGTLLYSGMFSDSVYRATPDSREMELAYYIDFGDRKFPERFKKGKDEFELTYLSNKEENIEKYVSNTMYKSETDDKFRFVSVFRKELYYTEYDRKSGDVTTIRIEDPDGELTPQLFVYYTDDAFYIAAQHKDINSNLTLVRFGYDVFK